MGGRAGSMGRRRAIALTVGMLASSWGVARAQASRTPTPATVVKIVDFSCPICKASEPLDEEIRRELDRQGGTFSIAAMPAMHSNGDRERAYYLFRSYGPQWEKKIRESLYRGSADVGMGMLNGAQVLTWLENDMSAESLDWEKVLTQLRNPDTDAALARAVRLAMAVSANKLPTYVVIRGGQIASVHEPGDGSLSDLKARVLAAAKPPTPASKE